MKILHVYRTYFPETQGGLEETIRQICLNSGEYGFTHRIFTLADITTPDRIDLTEAEVFRFPLSFEIASCGFSKSGAMAFKKIASWADLIHYHYPWPFADLLDVMFGVEKPRVVTYHSDIVRQKGLGRLYAPLRYFFLRKADRIVASSPNYYRTSAVLQAVESKVSVIPFGLDETVYPDGSFLNNTALLKEYGEGYFLFVGVLRYYKGLKYLIEAVKNKPYVILIAGSGPVEQQLKKQAEEQKLSNIYFLGHISDQEKIALMLGARAIVFPSCERSEAFGITLLEGSMCSKALITAEIGTGTSYINLDGVTGIIVSPKDSLSLAEALDKLYNDPSLADRMGKNARMRFLAEFTGDRMGKRYADLYREILDPIIKT